MISKEQFESFWKDNYNNIVPLGYILTDHFFNDRWFRIHSLPESKRYPDDELEMKIILDRQNVLINDLIGKQKKYLLLRYKISEKSTAEYFSEINDAIILDSICLNKALPDWYDYTCYLNICVTVEVWEMGSIDNDLKGVANNEYIFRTKDLLDCFLIIDMDQNRIIAPYDGGVDIFLNTTEERDYFKSKYKEWLSFTESGL